MLGQPTGCLFKSVTNLCARIIRYYPELSSAAVKCLVINSAVPTGLERLEGIKQICDTRNAVIAENQRLDHEVTISEVKDIVDDAIYYANKRTVGHYFDTIFGKRYDEEDMIILREKDFMH